MKELSVFDKLASELSRQERKLLLEKIKQETAVSDKPLINIDEQTDVNLEEEYRQFGFFKKITIFIRQIFTGKDYIELTELLLLKRLEKTIEKKYPGLFFPGSGLLVENMKVEIESLRDSVSIFKVVLDKAGGKNKNDFFAFLGSLEMEMVHEKLLIKTDPYKRNGEFVDKTDQEVKEELDFSLDETISEINAMDRDVMYSHSRSLHNLYEISFFLYNKIVNRFEKNPTTGTYQCSVHDIEEELEYLHDVLEGFIEPPGANLLHSLFLFQYQEEMEKEDFELEDKIKKKMEQANSSLARVRQFNYDVPLLEILKYTNKNINYHSNPIKGGEDWFVIYKQFWKRRMELLFKQYSMERKKRNIMEDAVQFVGLDRLPTFDYYNSEQFHGIITLKYEKSLAFLLSFVHETFQKELNRILKPILIDGEFYKEQNRLEFTDAYNTLMRVPDQIKSLEYALTTSGDTGKAIEVVKHEILPPSIKRKKMQHLLTEVEKEAEQVVKNALYSIQLLQNVLYGILHGEVGGKYDSISNLGVIGGRKSNSFLKQVEKAVENLSATEEIISSLMEIESAL